MAPGIPTPSARHARPLKIYLSVKWEQHEKQVGARLLSLGGSWGEMREQSLLPIIATASLSAEPLGPCSSAQP